MARARCCETITDREEWATRELREALAAAGWKDVEQYRVQVLYNGAEPVCPTPQQRQRARRTAEEIARIMDVPASFLDLEADRER